MADLKSLIVLMAAGAKNTLVILFGHPKGPRTGFPEPPLYYSHGLDMVTGRAAGPSFVLNKWHFLPLTLAVDPQVPCGWLGNVQPGWDQHSLRDVNKVYMWVLLCRQSEVSFSYIISISMCPECLISALCVLSHTKPKMSRAKAN